MIEGRTGQVGVSAAKDAGDWRVEAEMAKRFVFGTSGVIDMPGNEIVLVVSFRREEVLVPVH